MAQTIRRIIGISVVGLLAATSLGITAGSATAAQQDVGSSVRDATSDGAAGPQPTGPESGKVEGFVAVPVGSGSTLAQQPSPTECFWGWNWEAGGFYPEAWLRYAATFECGSLVIPDVTGVLQGSLHRNPGGLLLHQGPDVPFLFFGGVSWPPVTSGGEITLTGPGSFYINNNSIVDLLPMSTPTGEVIWIWAYLPPGCGGVGTPRAICDLDTEPFNIT